MRARSARPAPARSGHRALRWPDWTPAHRPDWTPPHRGVWWRALSETARRGGSSPRRCARYRGRDRMLQVAPGSKRRHCPSGGCSAGWRADAGLEAGWRRISRVGVVKWGRPMGVPPPFRPGDAVPMFQARASNGNPSYDFGTVAGRYVALGFLARPARSRYARRWRWCCATGICSMTGGPASSASASIPPTRPRAGCVRPCPASASSGMRTGQSAAGSAPCARCRAALPRPTGASGSCSTRCWRAHRSPRRNGCCA